MSAATLVAPLAAITGADVFGLVISALVCIYLVYALLRGEKL
jgi:K+-transporting ATPase KdpF subunit